MTPLCDCALRNCEAVYYLVLAELNQTSDDDRYAFVKVSVINRARRQSGFPTFIPCQRQDAHVLRKRRQSHQGDKLCDVNTVPLALVARWPVFSARGSDADDEPHGRRTPLEGNQAVSSEVGFLSYTLDSDYGIWCGLIIYF